MSQSYIQRHNIIIMFYFQYFLDQEILSIYQVLCQLDLKDVVTQKVPSLICIDITEAKNLMYFNSRSRQPKRNLRKFDQKRCQCHILSVPNFYSSNLNATISSVNTERTYNWLNTTILIERFHFRQIKNNIFHLYVGTYTT